VERLVAVRQAVGPEVALRLDVNGAWAPGVAAERLSALAEAGLGLEYVEQPLPAGPIAQTAARLASLRAVTAGAVPIAADESVTSWATTRTLLAAGAVDALVVKPARVGGPSGAMAIAMAAAQAGVTVTISTLLETGVGLLTGMAVAALASTAGTAHGLGTGGLLAADLVGGLSVVTKGIASSGLGADGSLGLSGRLDAAAVARYAVGHAGVWA
jgi:O-succinylbenzoate synthase